jgi:glycosyltransferase involved in cell wall biosynthesis
MSGIARPRIVAVVDRPGWAHDRKTDAIARVLADRYEIVKVFQAEATAEDLESADAVLLYYWLQWERLPGLHAELHRRRERVVIGVCSHYELEGEWRQRALAILGEKARAVFANNRALHDELAAELPGQVFYTPNGVDCKLFRPLEERRPSSPHGLRVGWAGSLENQGAERRGVHEIIAPAVAAVEGAELCLAVREERWRTQEEMVDFYHSIDVYVCASRSEGTPNPCLEAAACGVPVVSVAVGNMPEFVSDGENGFLVERTVEAIADRLAALRDDAGLRARIGAAARATAERWDWRRQALRYVPLFDKVIDGVSA